MALSKCIAAAVVTSFSVAVSTVSQQSVMMDHLLIKDQVTMAEIIWALHGIMSHSSVQGNISAADLFHLMFSHIAARVRTQKNKNCCVVVMVALWFLLLSFFFFPA